MDLHYKASDFLLDYTHLPPHSSTSYLLGRNPESHNQLVTHNQIVVKAEPDDVIEPLFEIQHAYNTEEVWPTEGQIFGKHFAGETMVLLSNEIYCKKSVYEMALGSTYKASTLARRLMDGVFTREALLHTTLTGKNVMQKDRPTQKGGILHREAKDGIIEFSLRMCRERGWEPQTEADLLKSMSSKMTEMKNAYYTAPAATSPAPAEEDQSFHSLLFNQTDAGSNIGPVLTTALIKKEKLQSGQLDPYPIIQLFGEHCPTDTMIPIGNGIFCKKKYYDMAVCCSVKSSQVVRRLLEGIFSREALVNSTITGQATRRHGKDRFLEKYDALDLTARETIIEFALNWGKERGWPAESVRELNRSVGQRITEVKRMHAVELLQQSTSTSNQRSSYSASNMMDDPNETILYSDEDETNDDFEMPKSQLYGKDYSKDEMILLRNDVYCRKKVYDATISCSTKVTHVIRRLLEGVFTKRALVNGTLTGKTAKRLDRYGPTENVDCLDPNARFAIIEFAKDLGIEKGWASENQLDINRAMTQKVAELKRIFSKNVNTLTVRSTPIDIKNYVQNCEMTFDDTDPKSQLYGKDYKEDEMVLLCNDIYCTKRLYDMAISSSTKVTHVVRRLLEGVFKLRAILSSTLTGQSTRRHGREHQFEIFDCLDTTAKDAIIQFATKLGAEKGWPTETLFDLNKAISQRIGEVKRRYVKTIDDQHPGTGTPNNSKKNLPKEQLFGKDCQEDEMILLCNEIYCKKRIYDIALQSCKATQVVRRILEGVFLMEALVSSTLTGQGNRRTGKDRPNEVYNCLDPYALKSVIEFALDLGKKLGWEPERECDLKRAITQRLTEIKRMNARDVLQTSFFAQHSFDDSNADMQDEADTQSGAEAEAEGTASDDDVDVKPKPMHNISTNSGPITQLFGPNCKEDHMILLCNEIYCKKRIYDMAIQSTKATIVVRRILEGVFTTEALVNSTLTGQTGRRHNNDRNNAFTTCLDPKALRGVMDFALDMGKKAGWEPEKDIDLKKAVAQRLTEVKKMYARGLLQNSSFLHHSFETTMCGETETQSESEEAGGDGEDVKPTRSQVRKAKLMPISQLFGKDWKEDQMILLSNEIYCKKRIYDTAIHTCKSTQIVRRMLEGVFTTDALINSTITGQVSRRVINERPNEVYTCLDPTALRAIMNFALDWGRNVGWEPERLCDLKRAAAQKLAELKRQYSKDWMQNSSSFQPSFEFSRSCSPAVYDELDSQSEAEGSGSKGVKGFKISEINQNYGYHNNDDGTPAKRQRLDFENDETATRSDFDENSNDEKNQKTKIRVKSFPQSQLFGKDCEEEEMVLLSNDIYCKRSIYELAVGSKKTSHVVRRLIEGVFTLRAIMNCTLTGQPARAHGRERSMEQHQCLDPAAKTAIIDFALKLTKENGWESESMNSLTKAMSQKIGEIKRTRGKSLIIKTRRSLNQSPEPSNGFPTVKLEYEQEEHEDRDEMVVDDQDAEEEMQIESDLEQIEIKPDPLHEYDDYNESNDTHEDDDDHHNNSHEPNPQSQLFGKDFPEEEMILLDYEIYCKKSVYDTALTNSYKASHIARRLMDGVYKREAIIQSTLTGKSTTLNFMHKLNPIAKKAITEFAVNLSKQRGWVAETENDLNRSLTQKIGETRRSAYKEYGISEKCTPSPTSFMPAATAFVPIKLPPRQSTASPAPSPVPSAHSSNRSATSSPLLFEAPSKSSQATPLSKAELLRKQILEMQAELKKLEEADSSKTPSPFPENQLFGKDCNEEMILLTDDIYCKKSIYDGALKATKASSFARRLLQGVFKNEAIVNSTLTGQSPRAQGKERQRESFHMLDTKAKNAIIEFSLNFSKEQGWEEQTQGDLKKAISQKIVELKKYHQKRV